MSRTYQCLPIAELGNDDFKIVPIRDEDKYAIMRWRNDQISILRQSTVLTPEDQENYFSKVINGLFEVDKPPQILFSFLYKGDLIGYGGLVHIDWINSNAEISFITETIRNKHATNFISDWKEFLKLLKWLCQRFLGFNKIYTSAFDVRPNLYIALIESEFSEEARLVRHALVDNNFKDVLIHSYLFSDICFRVACISDCETYFHMANDDLVRKNSFNSREISWKDHQKWFAAKIEKKESLMLIAIFKGLPIGQIRFDPTSAEVFEIDFSINPEMRGRGFGKMMLLNGIESLKLAKPHALKAIGKVRYVNGASIKSFKAANFIQILSDDCMMFEKSLR